MSFRVKPVPWRELFEGYSTADTALGSTYNIKRSISGKSWMVNVQARGHSRTLGYSENAEAAKALAQADYERLILSALEQHKENET
jgi:hypothetical protein